MKMKLKLRTSLEMPFTGRPKDKQWPTFHIKSSIIGCPK